MRWLQDLRTIFNALDARMTDEHWATGSPEKRARTTVSTVLRNLLQGQAPHQKTGINLLEMADETLIAEKETVILTLDALRQQLANIPLSQTFGSKKLGEVYPECFPELSTVNTLAQALRLDIIPNGSVFAGGAFGKENSFEMLLKRLAEQATAGFSELGGLRAALESIMQRQVPEEREELEKDQAVVTRLISNLMNLAHLLIENNAHEKAGQLYERALALQERISAPDSSAIAETLYFLGINLTILEENEKAKAIFDRALRIEESLTTHPGLTRVLLAFGKLIIEQDAKTAKGYFERALDNQKKHHGTDTIGVAKILLELGYAHEMLGDPRTAQHCYQQSLDIQYGFYRDHNNPGIARALSGIGVALSSLGQYENAKRYLEKALNTQNFVDLGHSGTMRIKVSLANVLIPLGKLHQAEQLYDDALKILGDQEPASRAIILTNYANVLALLNKQGFAIQLLKNAIDIGLRHYPENHPVLAMTYYTLGDILVDQHPRDAIPHLEKSLEIRKNYYGEHHQKVAVALRALGWAYKKLGDFAKAIKCLESARAIFQSNNLRTQETEVLETLTEIQQRPRQTVVYQGRVNPASFLGSPVSTTADPAASVITMDNIPAFT